MIRREKKKKTKTPPPRKRLKRSTEPTGWLTPAANAARRKRLYAQSASMTPGDIPKPRMAAHAQYRIVVSGI